jgi:hypothetical protein
VPQPPDDVYLRLLGHVTYDVNCLEWLAIEVIRRLDPGTSMELLAGMTARGIAEQFASKARAAQGRADLDDDTQRQLRELAAAYLELPPTRNDSAHARGATTPDGRQRLYRWAPNKSDFTGWVDEEFLRDMHRTVQAIESGLDSVRQKLPTLP